MIDLIINPNNTWTPSELSKEIVEDCLREAGNSLDGYLSIFQTEPCIDSLFIKYRYKNDDTPEIVKRFTFQDGFVWNCEDEKFFVENCLLNCSLEYTYTAIDPIYLFYSKKYPEWHLKRYYTKNIRLLDHIYHCMRKKTAKEMLYKAGLDELAINIDDIDTYNLLSSKPSDIYDGVSMRALRALNCRYGSLLLGRGDNRMFIKELQMKFPDLFNDLMNDAQCQYLNLLIDNKLTVGEAGRLFRSRRQSLVSMWISSQYDSFLFEEKQFEENRKIAKELEKIDSIYKDSIANRKLEQNRISMLSYYLLQCREDFDAHVRRSNRKRRYDWQERDQGYVVRYPQTINDFCREAVYMCNCLLGYAEAFVNNATDILFIRKQDDVNQPFITMEVYKGELMQAYHRFNEDCTPEEANWIHAYCGRHGIGCGRFQFNFEVDQLY